MNLSKTTCKIHDIQKELNDRDVFTDYTFLGPIRTILATKITSSAIEVIELNVEGGKLAKKYKDAIIEQDYDSYVETALKLREHLIDPLNIGNKEHLIFCLDGSLHNIPFDAFLMSDENTQTKDYRKLDYLLHHHSIQTVLAPQLMTGIEKDKHELKINAFQPQPKKGESELPFNKQLINTLHKNYNAQVYFDDEATKSNVLRGNNGVLHLSSHAYINENDYENAKISLSSNDLKPKDFSSFEHLPKIIILNTCNSSLGKVYQGEGVDGFTRYARMNGVQTVLTNLWEVDDRASSIVLEKFYSNLFKGRTTSKALQRAKVDYITSAKNSQLAGPYYWAGHRVVGEDFRFKSTEERWSKWSLIYWLIIIMVFFATTWWVIKINS